MSIETFTCETCPMRSMLKENPTVTNSKSVQRLIGQIELLDRTMNVYGPVYEAVEDQERQATFENFYEEIDEYVFSDIKEIITDCTSRGETETSADVSLDDGISIAQCGKRILDIVCVKTQF